MEERVSQVSPQGSSERGGRPVMAAIVGVDQAELQARVDGILNRHPAVGLAVGVVRNGSLEFFLGHGLADIASSSPVTGDTVFRIGSITKTFTAIAVMQLWEQGLVDLDAPANDYLRAYKLVPAEPSFRPAILRHLLTHTAGIPEVVYAADLLHPSWGPFEGRPVVRSVKVGEPLPSLAEYYRGGLRLVAEPGSAFAYSNHGFATLGQIVEDVSGVPLERYLRERIFEPLGMADSDLVRSERVTSRLATGYVLGPRGASPVPDRDWVGAGGGGIYSTTRDLARYLAALLGGGANEHGSVLEPATLATMFEPHYSRIRACRGWASRSSAATRASIASSGTTGSFRASTRSSPWLPTTVSASSPSRTGRAERSCGCRPSSEGCCATCSASPTRSCAPTFPTTPRSGATSAATTGFPRESLTSAGGWRRLAVRRSSSAAGDRCSAC